MPGSPCATCWTFDDSLGCTLSTKAALAMSSVSRRRDQASSSSQCFASWEQDLLHTCDSKMGIDSVQPWTFDVCNVLEITTPSIWTHVVLRGIWRFKSLLHKLMGKTRPQCCAFLATSIRVKLAGCKALLRSQYASGRAAASSRTSKLKVVEPPFAFFS